MKNIITRVTRAVYDIMFPPVCLCCHASIPAQERLLCENCFAHIRFNTSRHRDNVLFATQYEEPMRSLIRYFKYGKLYKIGYFLSAICIAYAKHIHLRTNGYVIVPIPLYPWKERIRGFNQSEVIAKRFAEYFNIPVSHLLVRTRHTPSQTGLTLEKRRKNVAGCFSVRPGENISGKKIIVFDDVCTTGATVYEASAILRTHGASKVICFVAARV